MFSFRFSKYFLQIGQTDAQVKRLLMGYLNGIQAVYMLPSLGEEITFSVVRYLIYLGNLSNLDKTKPVKLVTHLQKSLCEN